MQTNTPNPVKVMTGFFTVEGFGPDVVEILCTGIPATDYSNLLGEIRKRHPGVSNDKIVRTGSSVELRDPAEDPGVIDLDSGKTLRQLFDVDAPNVPPRSLVRIGKVFFSGSPYTVFLTHNRGAGRIGIWLKPRTTNDMPITLTSGISPALSVLDLERTVTEVIGSDGRMLELNIRRSKGT